MLYTRRHRTMTSDGRGRERVQILVGIGCAIIISACPHESSASGQRGNNGEHRAQLRQKIDGLKRLPQ